VQPFLTLFRHVILFDQEVRIVENQAGKVKINAVMVSLVAFILGLIPIEKRSVYT
jgi:hypothetical protein